MPSCGDKFFCKFIGSCAALYESIYVNTTCILIRVTSHEEYSNPLEIAYVYIYYKVQLRI